jgi:uncharacterized cupin superfamily protein
LQEFCLTGNIPAQFFAQVIQLPSALGDNVMQIYKQLSNETGLELWPDFEEEGVEVLAGNPKQSGRIDWGNIEGPMAVGIWECTPGKVRLINPFSELCTICQGRVTVIDGDGRQTTFGPGDSFFIAQGETSTWDVHETIQKAFFLYIDAEP